MTSLPLSPPRALPWVLRKNFLVGIRLVSGFFGERGWFMAYGAGKSGRDGEDVGGMGRDRGRRSGVGLFVWLEAYRAGRAGVWPGRVSDYVVSKSVTSIYLAS
jgi:hypothetical protein